MSTEPEAVEPPPVRVWRRLFLLASVLTLFVIAFMAMRWAYQRYHTTKGLEELIARLDADDPGWRLDEIEATRSVPPTGENSAEVTVAVAKLVPGNWPYWDHDQAYENRWFEGLPVPALLDAERAKMLAEEMAKVAPALAEARRLAAMPLGKHKIEFAPNAWNTVMDDQQDSWRSAGLLRYDARRLAQKGDVNGALLAGRACLNAGRSLIDEPADTSQLVRVHCVELGLDSVEQSLAMGEAGDADLAEVQKLLRLEERHPTLLVAMRGARAMAHSVYDGIATGKLDVVEALSGLAGQSASNWWSGWIGVVGVNLPRQHLLTLEMLTEMVKAAKLPPHEQIAAEKAIEAKVDALPRCNVIAKSLLRSKMALAGTFRRKLGEVRTMDALLAAERYRLKKGRWPDKLEDLPKEMMPSVPLDPYDGAPVRYRRTADGGVAYVLGDNLRDDGGAVERLAANVLPPDCGYRLWDVTKRRQPPVPKPANDVPGPGM